MITRRMAFALLAGSLCAAGGVVALAGRVAAQEGQARDKAGPSVTVPQTSKEHTALAEAYRKKAASYREEADVHRRMLEAYKKQVAVPTDAKTPVENPWLKKMRVHCEAYIRDAEALAADADSFAEFHTMRAAEMQGK